jgi:trimethylamine--corrinoid protein Co-methyltransferase
MASALAGTDLVRSAAFLYHAKVGSPEVVVFGNEIVDMVKVLLNGIEINKETLPIEMMVRMGPKANYLFESHTRQHFRKFWSPPLFDRSFNPASSRNAEDLINQRTKEIIETHQPKALPADLVRELKKMEKTWFQRVGLKHEYPKRKER